MKHFVVFFEKVLLILQYYEDIEFSCLDACFLARIISLKKKINFWPFKVMNSIQNDSVRISIVGMYSLHTFHRTYFWRSPFSYIHMASICQPGFLLCLFIVTFVALGRDRCPIVACIYFVLWLYPIKWKLGVQHAQLIKLDTSIYIKVRWPLY